MVLFVLFKFKLSIFGKDELFLGFGECNEIFVLLFSFLFGYFLFFFILNLIFIKLNL